MLAMRPHRLDSSIGDHDIDIGPLRGAAAIPQAARVEHGPAGSIFLAPRHLHRNATQIGPIAADHPQLPARHTPNLFPIPPPRPPPSHFTVHPSPRAAAP